MTLLTQINWLIPELPPGAQRIARAILADAPTVASQTSTELAILAGCSQSAVVKFCQRMKFKGFPEFQAALRRQLYETPRAEASLHNHIATNDSLAIMALKLADEKRQSIEDTTRQLDLEAVAKVVEMLHQASRVQIIGLGGSGLVARDLGYKLQKIGLSTSVESDHHVQITVAQTLKSGDVQIALSFSGERKDMLVAAKVARDKGALVVAITGNATSRLARIADVVLEIVADENTWRSSAISSRSAQNTVTDLLFLALLQKREHQARQLVEHARVMINSLDD